MAFIKYGSVYSRCYYLVSSTDHITPATGMSPTVKVQKQMGAVTTITTGELSNGWYYASVPAAQTDSYGDLMYYITATGADPVSFTDQIVGFDPADPIRMGLTALPNVAPGTSNGLLICGNNVGGTVFSNPNGSGMIIQSTGNNGFGLAIAGNGVGSGLLCDGGVNGNGIIARGGATSGTGIHATAQGGNSDGMRLQASGTGVDLKFQTPSTNLPTVGSVTGSVGSVTGAVGSVTGAVGSVTGSVGSVTNPVDITQAAANKVWASPTRTLTSATGGGATAQEVWEYSTRTLTSGGGGSLTASDVWTFATRTLTGAVTVATNNDKAGYSVSTVSDKTGYSLATPPPTAVQIRQEIDSNSTKLDATVSSRSTFSGGPVASVSGNVGGNVLGSVGSVVSFGTLVSDVANAVWAFATRTLTAFGFSTSPTPGDIDAIADKVLGKDLSTVTSPASRSLLNAVRFLRNKWSISGGNLVVKKEDDTTDAWSAAVTTTADAQPITTVDPV